MKLGRLSEHWSRPPLSPFSAIVRGGRHNNHDDANDQEANGHGRTDDFPGTNILRLLQKRCRDAVVVMSFES